MTKSSKGLKPIHCPAPIDINPSTNLTTWVTSNAIPDSIIMNMICRTLLPPVEPKVCSNEVVVGIARVTLKILNTIMLVIRAFTAMEAAKAVESNVFPA